MKKTIKIIFIINMSITGNARAETTLINGIADQVEKITRELTKRPIEEMGEKMQKKALETKYINDNPDIMDMPPWEHENKWNKISNAGKECWYHRKSQKKVCR